MTCLKISLKNINIICESRHKDDGFGVIEEDCIVLQLGYSTR